jgi:glycerol-3-phosphate acyltransferase PlsY
LIVKIVYRDDIRRLGSGNIGFTNVYRMYGWAAGLLCFALDIVKGLAPVVLAARNLGIPASSPGGFQQAAVLMSVGVVAILGHVFTPWLRFKGGKGVATGLGVLIGLFGWTILIPLAVFLVAMLPTRYISLGSICAAFAVAVVPFLISELRFYWLMGVLTLLLVLFTHRENIKRLIVGKENRFEWKRGKR